MHVIVILIMQCVLSSKLHKLFNDLTLNLRSVAKLRVSATCLNFYDPYRNMPSYFKSLRVMIIDYSN